MTWFGESWGAPVCDPQDHADGPATDACILCERRFEPDAQGLTMPSIERSGSRLVSMHIDCFLDNIGAPRERPAGRGPRGASNA